MQIRNASIFRNDRWLVLVSAGLIAFGVFNITVNAFAQEPTTVQQLDWHQQLIFTIVENLLTQVGPVVGGAVGLGMQFARKKGLLISAEAEEYFVNMAGSFVANQSRWIYQQMRDNPTEWGVDVEKGTVRLPPKLGAKAKENVIKQLKTELLSDEFTNAARNMLTENLDALVERMVTQNNRELSERSRSLIRELAPLVVDSALLPLHSKEEAKQKQDEIIKSAIDSIKKQFDFEEIIYDKNFAEVAVRSELNKRIGDLSQN